MNAPQRGLSLIELLLVVAVVGMLAGIAYPSYTDQVRRAARAEAVATLQDSALRLERHYSRAGQYHDSEALITPLPPGSRYYSLVTERGGETFRLVARRLPGGLLAQDRCGDFMLDQAGVQGHQGASGDTAGCWGS
ncbi:MAG TPA: type IV pilin protein [Pseudomonas sp.]|uniref:type IV pilin protein n=1 Tax=Pseudomonas sp. TaxID=306 RepID=UPI002B45EC84|nr:type IV pilin protein [Pseudomonas sp.]HKS13261.1 type IV pilin protein [Pseudomonas sp.]